MCEDVVANAWPSCPACPGSQSTQDMIWQVRLTLSPEKQKESGLSGAIPVATKRSSCQDVFVPTPDAPTTPSGTIDRLTTPSSLLWHPRRCYGRSPFVIHFLQVYNPTMSVIQFFLAKLYGTRRGNNWHEGFHYKANGKTKLWSSESRGNKQIWRKFWHSSRYTNPYKYNRHTGKCGYVVRRCAIQKK